MVAPYSQFPYSWFFLTGVFYKPHQVELLQPFQVVCLVWCQSWVGCVNTALDSTPHFHVINVESHLVVFATGPPGSQRFGTDRYASTSRVDVRSKKSADCAHSL